MNDTMYLVTGVVGLLVVIIFGGALFKRRTNKALDVVYFQKQWKDLQGLCADKRTWPLAIIDADKLVDEALRKSRIKGKTMGERLVSAQRMLSNNDSVWFAHKLRNRLVHEQYTALKERDVKDALIGFRQALKDLGALK